MEQNPVEPLDMQDKRACERLRREYKISYATLSRIQIEPMEFGNATTMDISTNGLSLLVDEPVAVPILIQARLFVPGEASEIFVLGKTVYCSPIEGRDIFRVGVKFVGILPGDLGKTLRTHGAS